MGHFVVAEFVRHSEASETIDRDVVPVEDAPTTAGAHQAAGKLDVLSMYRLHSDALLAGNGEHVDGRREDADVLEHLLRRIRRASRIGLGWHATPSRARPRASPASSASRAGRACR